MRLRFAATMTDRVIRVTFEWDVGVMLSHPIIERVVEKKICEQRTDDGPLRRSFLSANQHPIRHEDGRFEPSLQIQQHPWTVGVSPHRSHQEFMIDFVKETFDIKIKHPVLTPTPLTCDRKCLMSGLAWPVSIRILV